MITTEELIRGFSEEIFSDWCRGKFADFVPASKKMDEGEFEAARQVGYVRTLADGGVNRPLLVAAVQVPGELGERSSRKRQFDFARKALQRVAASPPGTVKGVMTQGLFVFYGENGDFRMSLISGRVDGGKLAYNSFKRQTFFVRQDQVNRTFRDQMEKGLGDYKALCEAFSIEALTKQFYNELFAWYEWALSDEMDVRYPNDIGTEKDNRERIPEHMIRLITRLMFVWFIKQKHLVPEEIFRVEELRKLLKDFDPDSETEGNYYNAILQNLFFATLNNRIEDREFATNGTTRAENENHYGVKTLFRNPKGGTWFKVSDDKILKLFEKVPFLNGGLFECLDRPEDEKSKRILYYDGFSREDRVKGKLTRAFVPNCLFFDKDAGLIPLFQRYNFTVEENSPNDAEVALDPELLGKVFENLLGAYNPETQETARKQSGSFYTPREIVSYMVDESLKQYLKTQVQMDDAVLTPLFEEDAKVNLPAAKRKELAAAIRSVKILDPACGSGAFPMGALHRLVDLLAKLEGQAENLYDLKLHLIENCIYGVDIQSIAVQISKLRFFISLVCEQEPNQDKTKNYGILPLPNLETKFVCANTLIGLEKDLAGDLNLEDEDIAKLRKELWDIRHRHFLSKSSQEKHACRRQDKAVREKMQKRIVAIASTPDKVKIAHLEESIRKLEAEKAKYRGEKWETISVPKQGDLFGGDSGNAAEKKRVDTNKAKREEIEGRIERCERDIAAEKGKRVSRELMEAAENLAAWDPYDQNESSPFFDPEWMFGVKDGFDVVIGNPPYSAKQSTTMKLLRTSYKFIEYKCDPFAFFIEWGMRNSKKKGSVTFIVPVTWMTNVYYEKLRRFIIDSLSLSRAVLIRGLVFESANVDTSLLFLCNGGIETGNYGWMLTDARMESRTHSQRTYAGVRREPRYDITPTTDPLWDSCRAKIEKAALRLGSFSKISLGMKLARNDDYVVEGRDRGHPDPIIFGSDIQMYGLIIPSRFFNFANALIVGGTKNPTVQKAKPKIMVQAIRNLSLPRRIVATIDTHGCYFIGTVNSIIPHTGKWSPLYLLGLINSNLLNVYFRRRFTTISLTAAFLGELPIAPQDAKPHLSKEIIALVSRVLAAKAKNSDADTSLWERAIDERVYSLYDLTEDEIAVVENEATTPCEEKAKAKSLSRVKTKTKSALVDDEGLD